MTQPTKETLAKWLPLIIALLGNAVVFGAFYGRTQAEIANIRIELMPMEKRMEVFVTRREYDSMKEMVRDTNQKVDALYQQQFQK